MARIEMGCLVAQHTWSQSSEASSPKNTKSLIMESREQGILPDKVYILIGSYYVYIVCSMEQGRTSPSPYIFYMPVILKTFDKQHVRLPCQSGLHDVLLAISFDML